MLSSQAAARIFDLAEPFVKPAELPGSKVEVPLAVVDLFEADEFPGEDETHIDPAVLPADAAIGADEPDLEMAGVLEGRQGARIGPG